MQALLIAFITAAAASTLGRHETSPIGKVLDMLSNLQGQIVKDGEVSKKEYAEFAEWCEDRSRDLEFEIKTGTASSERLQATIAEKTASVSASQTRIEELVAAVSQAEQQLADAIALRKNEAKDFAAEEKELVSTSDMIQRAIGTLEKQQQQGASMLQFQSAGNVVQALSAMVQASLIGTDDADALSAFVQSTRSDDDAADGDDPGAPAAAAYKTQSGAVVDQLEDLAEKAESQLADVRKKESTAMFTYQSLKQSLENDIKVGNQDMAETKKSIASSSESKSSAEGDLEVTKKELEEDNKAKTALHQDCMSKADSFEAETKSREEELNTIASAIKFVQESMHSVALEQTSFLQVARSRSHGSHAHSEVLRHIRDVAYKQRSKALMQLVSQIETATDKADGTDPFKKVKGLISGMITRLEDAAEEDATKKAYCDKELGETTAKKAGKTDEIGKLSTKIEQMAAKSAMLKEEVAALETQLSKLLKSQAEMDKLRHEEKSEYEKKKSQLEEGSRKIKMAVTVLSEYYGKDEAAHGASAGAGAGIIGLLEAIEADLSKDLAGITSEEEAAAAEHEQVSSENEVQRAQKDEDVKHKTRESKQLDKASAEYTSDRTEVKAELSAVGEYLVKLEEECLAKRSSYSERKARREAEIQGLKEALDILVSDVALTQRETAHRTLRGGSARA